MNTEWGVVGMGSADGFHLGTRPGARLVEGKGSVTSRASIPDSKLCWQYADFCTLFSRVVREIVG